MEKTYDANVRVRDLSRDTDRIIGLLANVRACPKWEVVRDALDEYVTNHRSEISAAALEA